MNLSIRAKLLLSFTLLLLLLGATSYLAVDAIQVLTVQKQQIQRINEAVALGYKLEASVSTQVAAVRGYMLTQEELYITEYQNESTQHLDLFNALGERLADDQEIQLLGNIQAAQARFNVVVKPIFTRRSFTPEEIDDLMKVSMAGPRQQLTKALTDFVAYETQRKTEIEQQAAVVIKNEQTAVYALTLVALVLGIALALIISAGLAKAIRKVADAAKRLAAGDLRIDPLGLKNRDEVGYLARSFDEMVHQLRSLVEQVSTSSQTVADSAEQLTATTDQVVDVSQEVAQSVGQVAQATSSQTRAAQQASQIVDQLRSSITQIAAGAQDQARQAQETSSVVATMTSIVDDVAVKAQNVAASSQRALDSATTGDLVVGQTIDSMELIQQSALTSADRVKELGALSAQIGEITAVITEIAGQTNLLALNAAIEAARAGEHGRGFAVVAEEVRKLAERAADSAKSITGLIQSIQAGTAEAVAAMDKVQGDVEQGAALAGKTRDALDAIVAVARQTNLDAEQILQATAQIGAANRELVAAVEEVAAVTEEATAATEEMAAGSEEIVEAISGIASISEENAASAEEVAASMEEMNASAEAIAASAQSLAQVAAELRGHLTRFKL